MISCFALDKKNSVVNSSTANVKTYPEAQYMGLVQFHTTYWEFDRKRNYMPYLVLEGSVEWLEALDTKFPHNIDKVYFNPKRSLPSVRFVAEPTPNQLAELARKGFWSKEGCRVEDIVTTAKWSLELDSVIEELDGVYEKTGIPVMNVDIIHPYDNYITENQYNVYQFVAQLAPEENKVIESQHVHEDFTDTMDAQSMLEAEKEAAMQKAIEQQNATAYKTKSREELDAARTSDNIEERVDAYLNDAQRKRDADNAAYEEEKRRAEEELAAQKAAKSDELVVDPNKVEFEEINKTKTDDKSKLVETDDTNKFDSNAAIFAQSAVSESEDKQDGKLQGLAAELAKKLSGASENSETETEAKDDKNDNNSGAASGAQSDKVYTFEDTTKRPDEGKGNEKPADGKSDKKDDNNSGSGSNSDTGTASGTQSGKGYTFTNDSGVADGKAVPADKKQEDEKQDDKSDDKDSKADDKKEQQTKSDAGKEHEDDNARRAVQLETAIQSTDVSAASDDAEKSNMSK